MGSGLGVALDGLVVYAIAQNTAKHQSDGETSCMVVGPACGNAIEYGEPDRYYCSVVVRRPGSVTHASATVDTCKVENRDVAGVPYRSPR